MTFVETNGIRLHYAEHAGDGPAFVFMPGLTANARFAEGLVRAGLAGRLRVLAFDLRGRGLSDKPERGYSMAEHAADMLGALDALDLGRVVVGGHSFGGLLAYHLAASHPERIERAVVLDAPAAVHEGVLDQIAPSLARLERAWPSWDEYLAMVKAMPYFDGWEWDPALEAFYRADVVDLPDGSVRARSRPEHIRQAVEGTLAVDWATLVRRIWCPTLLVRATAPFGPTGSPPILSADDARRTLALLHDGRLLEIPGNHITFLFGGGAATVARAVAEFVAGV